MDCDVATIPAADVGNGLTDTQVNNDLTLGGGTIATSSLTLVQSAAPTPTAEGVVEWETDDDHIIIGDGTDQVEFVPTEDFSGDATVDVAGAVTVADNSHSHTASNISDQDAGTDITADLEEEGAINTTAVTGNAIDHAALVGTGASTAGWTNAIPDCNTENHLTFEQTGNTWGCEADDGGGGGMTSFDLDGDNNSPQTITNGNEVLIAGGDGIATTAAATDTVTVATASGEANFLADGGVTSLTCGASNQGKMQVLDDGALEYCDGATTSVLQTVVTSHSSDGGGLPLTAGTPKVGGDLRLVSLFGGDFSVGGNLVTIDDNGHNHVISNISQFTVADLQGRTSDVTTFYTEDTVVPVADGGTGGGPSVASQVLFSSGADAAAWDATPAIDCSDCTNIPAGSHDGTMESGVAFGFGDGTDATLTHTYANTGTDVTVAYSTGTMDVTGTLIASVFDAGDDLLEIPNGSAPVTSGAFGRIALDTTDHQIIVKGNPNDVVIPTRQTKCATIEDLDAADEVGIWLPDDAITVTQGWCSCYGADCATPGQFVFSDDVAGNDATGTVTCSDYPTADAKVAISGSNTFSAFEGVFVDVTNTPTTGGDHMVCFEYTTTRE
jgi:hypothetical protein